jgi:ankyrin repeat protein
MQLLLQHNQDTGSNTYASPAALKNAMCSAAQNEHLEAVRWLLDHGADASQALTACTETGHADILRLLLSRGADLHPDGPSQLTFVLLYKAPEVAQLLLEMGVPTNTTVLQRLERLQQKGTLCTHVSRISRHQSSALLEAAVRHGHTEFAQLWGQAHAAVHGGDSVAGQLEAS